MGDFTLNLRGRLRNFKLPASRPLVPLFEAVMNGLHAIAEAKRTDGKIVVEVVRRSQRSLDVNDANEVKQEPISAFVIRDNGIGFNPENYESFTTSDTLKKLEIGGRGVGRMTWVKAFDKVTIVSVYRVDGKLRRRSFTFSDDGTGEPKDEPATKERDTGTIVTLEGMHENFYKQLPRTCATIAQRMVDHFPVALRAKEARVILEDGDDTVNITREIELVLKTAKTSTLKIRDAKFKLTHVKITSPEMRAHQLSYLANERQVKAESLAAEVPQLRNKLVDEEGTGFWSLTLAESAMFDDSVSAERDTFHFPDEPDPLFANVVLTMRDIRAGIIPKIVEHLESYLQPLRERSASQAKEYVQNEAPQYRSLLKMKKAEVEAIPPDLPREKLDVELRRIAFKHEEEMRSRAETILGTGAIDKAAYEELVSEANSSAIDNLAKYVRDRRVILNFLRKAIRPDVSGKHALEEEIHRLVLPMRTTSDDVAYDQMNLWLIDERLAFHSYLASDKAFSTIGHLDSKSKERPDVIVFNRPMAFSEDAGPNFGSVVIIEFKRPMRAEYDDGDNPLHQVLSYVQEVREKRAKTRDGRPLGVGPHVPFYCYVICDLTPKLRTLAENGGLVSAWDGQGYFGYIQARNAYVEVISFDKLIDDAEKRNRVFFEKLGLPKS